MLLQTGGPELGPGRVTDTGNKRRRAAFKAGGTDKETFEEGFPALFHCGTMWNHVEPWGTQDASQPTQLGGTNVDNNLSHLECD